MRVRESESQSEERRGDEDREDYNSHMKGQFEKAWVDDLVSNFLPCFFFLFFLFYSLSLTFSIPVSLCKNDGFKMRVFFLLSVFLGLSCLFRLSLDLFSFLLFPWAGQTGLLTGLSWGGASQLCQLWLDHGSGTQLLARYHHHHHR